MLLYIFFGDILKEFRLPKMTDCKTTIRLYACDYAGQDEIALQFEANAGSWKLLSQSHYRIVDNGEYINEALIEDGTSISVQCAKSGDMLIMAREVVKPLVNFQKYYCETMKEITIGRTPDNIIVFNRSYVSSHHARISFEDEAAFLYDLGSRNGVYVNGARTQKHLLTFGDVIFIMGLKVVFLKNYIAINNPYDSVQCKIFLYNKPSFVSEHDQMKFTAPTEYFIRSPRVMKDILTDSIPIDPPPQSQKTTGIPIILTIGPSVTMSAAMIASLIFMMNANASGMSMIPSAITAGTMLLGAVLWPVLLARYNKKAARKTEALRIQKYQQYTDKTYQEATAKIEINRAIVMDRYPAIDTCVYRVMQSDHRLWERMPEHVDFLDIRLGIGMQPSTVTVNLPKESFKLEDDPLLAPVSEMVDRLQMIENVPVTVSLKNERVIGLSGDRDSLVDLVKCIMLQITALHQYTEVKLFAVYDKNEGDKWGFLKWIPHTWSEQRTMHFIATEPDEVREIFLRLQGIITGRAEKGGYGRVVHTLPHYVVFILCPELVSNEPVVKMLLNAVENLGVTLLMLSEEVHRLPDQCSVVVQSIQDKASVFSKNDPTGKMYYIATDTANHVNMLSYSKKMFNIKLEERSTVDSLPSTLTFLNMYKAGKVEHLQVPQRWGSSRPSKSLAAPIGVSASLEEFALDIHEKYHGPHGLVAGMTGSGKSELLQTYILSLAVNYHPHDVSFILIDYKGGGMANNFKDLPHVAGTITNLSGNQTHRSLISIKSELKKRQRIFAECEVNHIDAYQQMWKENKAAEPLPHLIVISDEFAELKAEQPEFMQELISAARIGRSLGMHLILATQKPSGVVNDQIWSNSRFRICLKVQDKADSTEMLHRPEAAEISMMGRAYIQIGNNEIFDMVQSAWSGAPYIPGEHIVDDETQTIHLIDVCGRVIRQNRLRKTVEYVPQTQLKAVVEYINAYAEAEGIKPLNVWLPSLPDDLILEELDKGCFRGGAWTPGAQWLNPLIGLYDDPSTQRQERLTLDIGRKGHTALYGAPTTGKTVFLQTLIYSLLRTHTPDEINVYYLDFGGRTTGYLMEAPHVGGVIFPDEPEKISSFFRMMKKELEHRKKLFGEYSAGNLQTYKMTSGRSLPAIIIMLDNAAAFGESFPEQEHELTALSRETNFGIFLVLTGNSVNAVKYKITQNFKLLLTLQLYDKFDYIAVVGQTQGLLPDDVKGRGLVKLDYPVEYQTALAVRAGDETERVRVLRERFREMSAAWKGARAKVVPSIPDRLTTDAMLAECVTEQTIRDMLLPIGYDLAEAEPTYVPLAEIPSFTVLGGRRSGKTNFMSAAIKMLGLYGCKLWIADTKNGALKNYMKNVDQYCSDEDSLNEMMENLLKAMQERGDGLTRTENENVNKAGYLASLPYIFVIIDDFDTFFDMASNRSVTIFQEALKNSDLRCRFMIGADCELSKYNNQEWFKYAFSGNSGLLLGIDVNSQDIYRPDMDYQQRVKKYDQGCGYLFTNSDYKTVKTPICD